jgi:DNA-binding transcriptional LysR family regulator
MRDAALAASDAVAEVQTEPRGTIRVTCPVTLAQTVLGELMPEFLKRCPLVQVEMQVTNRPVNLVEEGVDVALRVRATLEDSGSMVVKRLDSSRQILVASPDLLQRQGTPRSLEDLQLLDSMAMTAVDGHSSLLLVGPEGKEHRLQLQPRYVVDDLLTLKFAALAGSGMCWLPDYMCQDELTRGTLVQLLPHGRLRAASCMRCFPRRWAGTGGAAFPGLPWERMPGSSISAAQRQHRPRRSISFCP